MSSRLTSSAWRMPAREAELFIEPVFDERIEDERLVLGRRLRPRWRLGRAAHAAAGEEAANDEDQQRARHERMLIAEPAVPVQELEPAARLASDIDGRGAAEALARGNRVVDRQHLVDCGRDRSM